MSLGPKAASFLGVRGGGRVGSMPLPPENFRDLQCIFRAF